MAAESEESTAIDIKNEFNVRSGKNLPNHSAAMRGHAKFVKPMRDGMPTFRTRQSAYRFAAWLIAVTDQVELPDEEDQPFEFEDILMAVNEEVNPLPSDG